MLIETCSDALTVWHAKKGLTSLRISSLGIGHEIRCQCLMFSAIAEQLVHAGDVAFWKGIHERALEKEEVFPNTWTMCAVGMLHAMWDVSISAAMAMLRNEWAGGIAQVPADQLIFVERA